MNTQEREQYQENREVGLCPNCGVDVVEESAEDCRRNQKIIGFLLAEDAQPLLQGSIESIPCPKHPTKLIDYFCKTCS